MGVKKTPLSLNLVTVNSYWLRLNMKLAEINRKYRKMFQLFCFVAIPTNNAYGKNLHRRLNIEIIELSASR